MIQFQEQPVVDTLDNIIDDVIFGFCLEIHRMTKKGILFFDEMDPDCEDSFSKILDAVTPC